jgi:hypothetical protein
VSRALAALAGTIAGAAAVIAVLAPEAAWRRHEEDGASLEEAILARRRQGLATLLSASEKGLVPFDGVLIAVDQGVVRDVLRASLPYERVISARYRVRVTAAEASFEDGAALVRLEGRASFADRPEDDAWADVTVAGAVDVVELDPRSGTLRGAVRVLAMDARRVDVMGVRSELAARLVEDLGREGLDAFGALLSRIEVPVALEHEITLPERDGGGVRLHRATLPLRASVADVRAFGGRLWVSVAVDLSRNGR